MHIFLRSFFLMRTLLYTLSMFWTIMIDYGFMCPKLWVIFRYMGCRTHWSDTERFKWRGQKFDLTRVEISGLILSLRFLFITFMFDISWNNHKRIILRWLYFVFGWKIELNLLCSIFAFFLVPVSVPSRWESGE